jgi:hypothetical protein
MCSVPVCIRNWIHNGRLVIDGFRHRIDALEPVPETIAKVRCFDIVSSARRIKDWSWSGHVWMEVPSRRKLER